MRWNSTFLMVAVVALLAGCKPAPELAVVGKWKQQRDIGHSLIGALANSIMPSTGLELKADHTFALKLPDLELQVSGNSSTVKSYDLVEGTYTVTGSKVTFKVTAVGGKTMAQIQQEYDDRAAQAKEADKERTMEDNARKLYDQQNGVEPSPAGEGANPPAPPQVNVQTDKLILPETAELADDQSKITLRFVDGAEQPIDLEKAA